MILLDENIPEDQYQLLIERRIHVRQIGHDVGRSGIQDREILTLLHDLKRPTLFTLDRDFSSPWLCHPAYGLVFLYIRRQDVARYVQRVLKHPMLNTQAKRMGAVVRASDTGIHVWRRNLDEEQLPWP